MAAASPNNSSNPRTTHSSTNGPDRNTTFVQADPKTFRAVVQKLTGAAAGSPDSGERRPTARKLKIMLHNDNGGTAALHSPPYARIYPSSHRERTVVASPISPLDFGAARESPTTPTEEEERAIAAKGFYLHRSPLSSQAGSDPPELLPLFPLHSPRESYDSSSF